MKTKSTSRRNFLLAAGIGGAGTIAAVATLRKPAKVAGASSPAGAQPDGYRATEHVLKYYKTTEV
jgi:hypothetical protein